MSRIGLKPIPKPAGVKYTVNGNIVAVEGPKGKVNALLPTGIRLVEKDGQILAERDNDSQKAMHGLARSLMFNAVEGVTNGWKKELDIVGIGYRAEMKGNPSNFPCPPASRSPSTRSRPMSRSLASIARKLARLRLICVRCASPTHTKIRVSVTPTRS
jgi:hypothetical protein